MAEIPIYRWLKKSAHAQSGHLAFSDRSSVLVWTAKTIRKRFENDSVDGKLSMRFRMKTPFSNENGLVWTGPKTRRLRPE